MRCAALLGTALGVALGAGAGAAPRAGRFVRIERHAHGRAGVARLCSISSDGTGTTGFCMGKPDVGEVIDVLDATHVVATVRVASASPYQDCNSDTTVWMITGTPETGDLATAQGPTWGVIDVPLDPHTARLVTVSPDRSPTGHAAGDQIEAVDTDGDGDPDIEFVSFGCDELGNAAIPGGASGNCLEVWVASHHGGFDRLSRTRARTCY